MLLNGLMTRRDVNAKHNADADADDAKIIKLNASGSANNNLLMKWSITVKRLPIDNSSCCWSYFRAV